MIDIGMAIKISCGIVEKFHQMSEHQRQVVAMQSEHRPSYKDRDGSFS